MSIAKFKGRSTAGGANIQRQGAPQFRTQYSAYQRPEDDGATYPVYNPGAHQTAIREPNPTPPEPTPPEIEKNEKCLFIAFQGFHGSGTSLEPIAKMRVQIPQWNINETHSFTFSQFNVDPEPRLYLTTSSSFFGRIKKGTIIIASCVYTYGTFYDSIPRGFVVSTCKRNSYNLEVLVGETNYGNYFWLENMFDPSTRTMNYYAPPHERYRLNNFTEPFFDMGMDSNYDPQTGTSLHGFFINNQPGALQDLSRISGNITIKWIFNYNQKLFRRTLSSYPLSTSLLKDAKEYFDEVKNVKFTKEFTVNFDNTDYKEDLSVARLVGDLWLS